MSDRSRRLVGGLYGSLLSLTYALTAGAINWLLLRDVPLRVDWPGVVASAMITCLLGLGLGVLTAWPESFVKGLICGALGISIAGTLQALLTFGVSFQLSVALLLTLLSRAALGAPIALTVRSLTFWHEAGGSARPGQISAGRWLPLGAALLGLVFGSFSQMPPDARAAVRQTDRLIQKALHAPTPEEAPPALNRVPDFQARAVPPYQLEQRPVPFSARRLVEVRAYFESGLVVSCLYTPGATPVCEEAES